jgi:Mn-dependent DtxR family transcriptional regulator
VVSADFPLYISQIMLTKERRESMANNIFIKADEIAAELGVSKPYAYKLVKKMNTDLEESGFITIQGRVSRKYFLEKIYGAEPKEQEVM